MAPQERDDDEMDLINAEFDSMVADLNLDQSGPSTFLDELDAIESGEQNALYSIPRSFSGLRESIKKFLVAIRRWWDRPNNNDSDGAVV